MKKVQFLFVFSVLVSLLLFAPSTKLRGENSIDGDAANSTIGSIVYYLGHKYAVAKSPYLLDDMKSALNDESLTPTHKAICITPADLNQLHEIERDTTLLILYHPFNYRRIADDPVSTSSISVSGRESTTGDCVECNECLLLEEDNDSIEIYPIFVFWPVNQEIPHGVHYEFCYDAYIPDNNEGEQRPTSIVGRLMAYDNRLAQYTPLGQVELQYYRTNQQLATTVTTSTGYFSLINPQSSTSMTILLKNGRFVVRDSLTTAVVTYFIDDISNFTANNYMSVNIAASFYLDVYKAAQYYSYMSNSMLNQVTRYHSTGNSIDIHAINNPSQLGKLGVFVYSPSPHIKIWNAYLSDYSGAASKVFGTVNHELGHASQYATIGHDQMLGAEQVVKESFASFFGWYNVKEYYSDVVISDGTVHDICTQGRQQWVPLTTINHDYTPIFIDLYDDYNQRVILDNQYNRDPISNVPITAILAASIDKTTFQAVETQLFGYLGVYYGMAYYEDFIEPYSCFE